MVRVLLVHTLLGAAVWKATIAALPGTVEAVCFDPPLVHSVDSAVLMDVAYREFAACEGKFDAVIGAEDAAGPVAQAFTDGTLSADRAVLVDPTLGPLKAHLPNLLNPSAAGVGNILRAIPRAAAARVKAATTFRREGAAAGAEKMAESFDVGELQKEWSGLMRQAWEQREPFDDTLTPARTDLEDWYSIWERSDGAVEIWLPESARRLREEAEAEDLDRHGMIRWTTQNAPWVNGPGELAAMVLESIG